MSCSKYMPAPVCLIENDENGKLHMKKEAKAILDGINEPVVVVSVVGLYRTGKSYLMNRLAGQQSGFALGSTIESKTKGIWMWCVRHPNKKGHTLVLLDTEGLGDVAKGDSKNDGWIFCLAVLLSSTLVYNSRGTIDNTALEKLHYVAELAENIKIRSTEAEDEEDSEFVMFFPSFTWVVRDFTLDLEIDGKKVTDDDYLEFALNLKKGILDRSVGRKISDYNLPRECIKRYFPSRKCFVFPFPVTSQEDMTRLEILQDQDLAQRFLEVTGNFCDHMLVNSAVKRLKGGHIVTGQLLGRLVEIYVDTINSGEVPCLDNAVVVLANLENQAAVQEALKVYQRGMEEVRHALSLYVSLYLLEQNQMASERKCRDLLKDLFADMNKWLQDGEYSQSGGYELYKRDRDAIVEQYRREPNKGVRVRTLSVSISTLLEQKLKEEEEKRIENDRMMETENMRHEDMVKQMQEKFNKELEQQQQERDRAIESKLKEQEEMLKKGFNQKAENLEEEIKKLNNEKKRLSGGSIFKDYVMPFLRPLVEMVPNLLMQRLMLNSLKMGLKR
uniref:Guanylate-binding protein 1-like n=1 Tax=Sinocyclocheilus grahami TaxID=75366 RepID=A0A672T7T6_SINGR